MKKATAALILGDLQNDFLHPEGAYGRAGQTSADIAALPDRLAPLVRAARDNDILVVATLFTLVPGRGGEPIISPHLRSLRPFLKAGDFAPVRASFIPAVSERRAEAVTVERSRAQRGAVEEQDESPGYVTFVRGGQEYRLEPVKEDDELFFVIRDQTSGKTTYAASRFLYSALPKNGFVELDFNKAENPPCVFTDFATCPLPPPQNRMKLAVTAGEQTYGNHR